jgi:hypothetical protein
MAPWKQCARVRIRTRYDWRGRMAKKRAKPGRRKKNPIAAALVRLRWAKTTPADRKAAARKAARARWAKKGRATTT